MFGLSKHKIRFEYIQKQYNFTQKLLKALDEEIVEDIAMAVRIDPSITKDQEKEIVLTFSKEASKKILVRTRKMIKSEWKRIVDDG
jgi:predicted oxidoreductase (fatty acid repression mutant protein)